MRDDSLESTAQSSNKPPGYAGAAIFTLIAGAVYAYLLVEIPGFQKLFQGFGAALPLLTKWLPYSYYLAAVLLAGSGVLLGLLLYSRLSRRDAQVRSLNRVSTWNLVIAVALMSFVVIAAYLPIFKMGSAV